MTQPGGGMCPNFFIEVSISPHLLWDSMNFGILKIQGTATKNGSSKKGFPLYSHPQDNPNNHSFMAWYPGLILLNGYTNCPDIYHNGDN